MSPSRDELRARTEAVLTEYDPDLVEGVRQDREGAYLDLTPAAEADYRYTLYVGEPQIHAALMRASDAGKFWYWPFSEQDYRNPRQQQDHFFECVRLLLECPTRIVQRRTLLGARFQCEAETSAGIRPIGGSLGAWFGVPRTPGREHVYRSGPVVSGQRRDA